MGAGSVGCFIGGAWAAAGLDVAFLGREAMRAELAEHGLTLTDQEGWRAQLPPPAITFHTKPAALKKADIILLAVKSTGTEAAARDIARHARKGTAVLSFQNGVSNGETLKRLLPGFEIIPAMVPYALGRPGPGRFHRASWGELHAARHPASESLARRIGDKPGKLMLSDDITGVAWGKLLINLNNAINALSGLTILDELNQRDYRRVLAAAMLETLALLDAAGITPAAIGAIPPRLLPHAIGAPDWVFQNLFLRIQKIAPGARSSMADDFAAGRSTEIDYLNGEVVKLAERLGREAPVNQAIVDLVRQREAGVEMTWSARNMRQYVLMGHRGAAIFGY